MEYLVCSYIVFHFHLDYQQSIFAGIYIQIVSTQIYQLTTWATSLPSTGYLHFTYMFFYCNIILDTCNQESWKYAMPMYWTQKNNYMTLSGWNLPLFKLIKILAMRIIIALKIQTWTYRLSCMNNFSFLFKK